MRSEHTWAHAWGGMVPGCMSSLCRTMAESKAVAALRVCWAPAAGDMGWGHAVLATCAAKWVLEGGALLLLVRAFCRVPLGGTVACCCMENTLTWPELVSSAQKRPGSKEQSMGSTRGLGMLAAVSCSTCCC